MGCGAGLWLRGVGPSLPGVSVEVHTQALWFYGTACELPPPELGIQARPMCWLLDADGLRWDGEP